MVSRWFLTSLVVCLVRAHILQSLNNVINYGLSRNITNINFLLGIAIAKGQLHATEKYIKTNEEELNLKKLENKCAILLKTISHLDPLSKVLSSDIWSQDPPIQRLSLLETSSTSFASEPNPLLPSLSDICLRSILSNCFIEPMCFSPESTQAQGYPLTHQVLFWTIFEQVCDRIPETVMLRDKCGLVIGEHLDIAAMGLPPKFLDLYFEQVVVCGLHGFLPPYYSLDQQILLSLQTSSGCFSMFEFEGRKLCDVHLSGVAAAALSLMAKHNIWSETRIHM